MTSRQNRRSFLNTGLAATAGTVLGACASHAARPGAAPSARPFVTEVPGKTLIGCYSSVDQILNQPRVIDALQEKLGVNMLIVHHGITMPDWLKGMNPLGSSRFMHVPHVDDDSPLVRAIEETHRRGMDFWLYFTGHHYREESRGIMGETFEGIKFIDLPLIKYAPAHSEYTACFAKPAVRNWETAVFGYAAGHYDVDSMYVTHHRYATPSFWSNLFGCACPDCRSAAGEMGYDFGKMRGSMRSLLRRLERLDRRTVERFARFRPTFTDFLSLLGEDDGVMDWLYFRAKVVGNSLRDIHDAVHASSGHRSGFVPDTHGATMSLWVGHNWEDFAEGAADGLLPLSWAMWQYVSVIAAWANQLCQWAPGLDEAVALKLVTSFFGWEDIGLPDRRIADLMVEEGEPKDGTYNPRLKAFYDSLGPERLVKLMTHEWTRMAALNRGRIPAYPVIKGYEWPKKVCRELMDRTKDLGLSGYIIQRTDVLLEPAKG